MRPRYRTNLVPDLTLMNKSYTQNVITNFTLPNLETVNIKSQCITVSVLAGVEKIHDDKNRKTMVVPVGGQSESKGGKVDNEISIWGSYTPRL